MWEKLQKLFDRVESRIALWQLARGTGIVSVGAMSGWFSSSVEWINAFGPFGWLMASLMGALLASIVIAVFAFSRQKFAEARLLNRDEKQRPPDAINPLNYEFHRQRISLQDLKHPVTGQISGKSFTDCELLGPANILIWQNCNLTGVGFGNCDFVLTKQKSFLRNVIPLRDVSVRGGDIINATIFVHPDTFAEVRKMPGITFVNQTGDEEIDSRPLPGTE